MKAKQVLDIMQISRPILTRYVKDGLIKTTTLLNGRYDYDENSVYAFLKEKKSLFRKS